MKQLILILFLGSLLALLFAIWYLVRWIIGTSDKKSAFRNRFFLASILFAISLPVAYSLSVSQITVEALEAGFANPKEYIAARREHSWDPEAWAKVIAERKAQCRHDLPCWGNRAIMVAKVACPHLVEKFSQYEYEWTDSFRDEKFTHFGWQDIDNGIVTVLGDKIRFQNGFDAWSNMVYECDVDPETETVLDVRVSPGRI